MSSSKKLVMKCCLKDDGPPRIDIPTPREAMRRANCQDYRFHRTETYPSIRTQVSRCDPSKAQAIAWLANSLEADGCGRAFDMEQNDVQLLWQQSPRKDTLRFYGVGSPNHQPESVMFNQALMVSLKKASVDGTKRRSKRLSPPPPPKKTPNLENTNDNQMCQPYILNRQALQKELQQMPIVQQRLNPRSVVESVFCPDPVDSSDPFGVAQHEKNIVTRAQALDMERPPKKTPHGLRRRHWYCPPVESNTGGQRNACSQYECAKYKLEARSREFHLPEGNEIKSPEPKDYDQLYQRFLKCFEQEPSPDPICKLYEICCGKKKSHGDDGQGGGDGHGDGHGDGDGDDGKTGDQHKGKDFNKNKKNIRDNDKETDRDKDKEKDRDMSRDKNTNKAKGNENDGDTDKDMNQKKNKDGKADKNKNKDKGSGRGSRDSKNIGKDLDKYLDDTGGDGKGKKDKKKGKKPSLELARDPPIEIPEWQEKRESWSEDDDEGRRASQRKKASILDEISNDIAEDENEELRKIHSHKPIKNDAEKHKYNRHKDRPKNKDRLGDKNKCHRRKSCPACPPIGCPCEICSFMNRSHRETDAPFIKDMMRAEKKRQLQDYYRQMQHREYILKCRREEVRPPFHKCDPITCNNFFCQNPNFAKHCDCLGAVQDLQRLLTGCQDKRIDQKLLQRVEHLRQRINQRMCDCVLI